jgi:thiol-disulfide isomerase/thioredoxin
MKLFSTERHPGFMKKNLLLLLISVIIFSGCSDKNSITINGNFRNSESNYIYLNKINVDIPIKFDSARISRNGNFRLKIRAYEPDYYQLGFSSDFITILAEPGEKIKVTFEGKNLFENYSISGSSGSEQIKNLDFRLKETIKKLDSLKIIYNKEAANPDFKEKKQSLEEEFVKVLKAQRKYNIEFIMNNLNSLVSIKALYQRIDENTYVLYDPRDLQYLKIVSDSLSLHYPNSKQVKALAMNFEREMNQLYINQIEKAADKIPETKLDPDLKDTNGKRIALSSQKGKYVLLTFWSVSSEECISENLELKNYYQKYSMKGFEIYQINIDQNEDNWKKAVRFDELKWISVREDDPLNPRYSMLYNVQSLPTNYLYNKNGEIIGTNLHGRALQLKLAQLFGN